MTQIDHPDYYNKGNYEVIDVINDWDLNFSLGNVLKYIGRCNHKGNKLKDLKKAEWYLKGEIKRLEEKYKDLPDDWYKDTKDKKTDKNKMPHDNFVKDEISTIEFEIDNLEAEANDNRLDIQRLQSEISQLKEELQQVREIAEDALNLANTL